MFLNLNSSFLDSMLPYSIPLSLHLQLYNLCIYFLFFIWIALRSIVLLNHGVLHQYEFDNWCKKHHETNGSSIKAISILQRHLCSLYVYIWYNSTKCVYIYIYILEKNFNCLIKSFVLPSIQTRFFRVIRYRQTSCLLKQTNF